MVIPVCGSKMYELLKRYAEVYIVMKLLSSSHEGLAITVPCCSNFCHIIHGVFVLVGFRGIAETHQSLGDEAYRIEGESTVESMRPLVTLTGATEFQAFFVTFCDLS